jgi:hypothetical protein
MQQEVFAFVLFRFPENNGTDRCLPNDRKTAGFEKQIQGLNHGWLHIHPLSHILTSLSKKHHKKPFILTQFEA